MSARASLVTAVIVSCGVILTGVAGAAEKFSDKTGDAGTAPDLVSVDVSHSAGGEVFFAITAASALPSSGNHQVWLFLDTDANSSTGQTNALGAEYLVDVHLEARGYRFRRWSGSSWEDAGGTQRVSTDGATLRIAVNRADLGGTSGINFWVRALDVFNVDNPAASGQFDDAPDDGAWPYSLSATATPPAASTAPRVERFLFTGAMRSVRAGAVYDARAVRLSVRAGDAPARSVRPHTLSCTLAEGGKPLKALGTCRWRIPKSLKRTTLVLTLRATYNGVSARTTLRVRAT